MHTDTIENASVLIRTDYLGNRLYVCKSDDLRNYHSGGYACTADASLAIRFNGDASTVSQPKGTLAQWIITEKRNPADWRRPATLTIEPAPALVGVSGFEGAA